MKNQAEIEKLQKLLDSPLIPDAIKQKAKEKIEELKKADVVEEKTTIEVPKTEKPSKKPMLDGVAEIFQNAVIVLNNGPIVVNEKTKLIAAQVLIEALTDANFHSTAKNIAFKLDPSLKSDEEYYDSPYSNTPADARTYGVAAAETTGWDGFMILEQFILFADAYGFDELSKIASEALKAEEEEDNSIVEEVDNQPKIKMKEIIIEYAEGDNSKYDKFPKKYKTWEAANDAIIPIYKNNAKQGDGGYNKTGVKIVFEDGTEYDARLDVSDKTDNPTTTTNVVGKHAREYLDYLLSEKAMLTTKEKEEVKEWNKFDFGPMDTVEFDEILFTLRKQFPGVKKNEEVGFYLIGDSSDFTHVQKRAKELFNYNLKKGEVRNNGTGSGTIVTFSVEQGSKENTKQELPFTIKAGKYKRKAEKYLADGISEKHIKAITLFLQDKDPSEELPFDSDAKLARFFEALSSSIGYYAADGNTPLDREYDSKPFGKFIEELSKRINETFELKNKPEEKPTPSTGKKRLKDIADYVTRRNIEYVKFKVHGKEYTVASKNIIDGLYIKKDGHATEVRTQFKLGGGISANNVYISNRYIVEAVIKKDGKLLEYKGKDILDGIYVSKEFFGGNIPELGRPRTPQGSKTEESKSVAQTEDGPSKDEIEAASKKVNDIVIANHYGENINKLKKYQLETLRTHYEKEVIIPKLLKNQSDDKNREKELRKQFSQEYDELLERYSPDEILSDYFGEERDGRLDSEIKKMYIDSRVRIKLKGEKFGEGGDVSSNYRSINEIFRNKNKSVSFAQKVEIVKGLIDAGYTDADLTVTAKSGTAYTNKVDKKTEQVLAKFYKFYEGSLKGNMPFQTIYDIIDMNSRFKYNVLSTFKSIHKFSEGGPVPIPGAFDYNRFTLSELIHGYSDVEVARLVKDKSKYIQPEEINKKYKNFEFKLTTNGDIVVRKGSENYYLEIPVQAADTKYTLGDEFTIVLYTKDNKDGLKKIANSIIEKFKNGGYVRPSATMKTTGIYKFVTKDKEYILEVSMFERENELKDSLQIQNALRGELGSILINNNAWRRLSKGDTVTAKASKSDVQGKLTRIDDLENVRKHLLSK